MRRQLLSIVILLVLSLGLGACLGGGAGSGGTLALPESPTTITLLPTDDSSPMNPTTTTTNNPMTSTVTPSTAPSTTAPPEPSTTGPSTTEPTPPDDDSEDPSGAVVPDGITVYFFNDDLEAVPVTRQVTTTGVAQAAIEAIIDGPTETEQAAGFTTAMPTDALLLGATVTDGIASVDLSREAEAGGGATAITNRLAQLVYTLTEFPTVEAVQILIDGEERETFSGEGYIIDHPLAADEFVSLVPRADTAPELDAPIWSQADLGEVEWSDENTRQVVFVAVNDTLNVRTDAGVAYPVMGRLEPGVRVRLAGDSRLVGEWDWVTVETPAGPGWVNSFYLTGERGVSSHFAHCLVNDLRIRLGGDPSECDANTPGTQLSDIVSKRGLWIAHHADPIRFPFEEVDGLLTSTEELRWGSNALEPDSPELRPRTFKEAIADRFVESFDDDTQFADGEPIEGPNGRPAPAAVPTEFRGLGFESVFDPGDDPQYDGLDWTGWIVSYIAEDGDLKVVGLTIDEWAP